MSHQELKEYTRRIKELEVSIYTQKRLMKEHKHIVSMQKPSKPIDNKSKIKMPLKPEYNRFVKENTGLKTSIMWAIAGIIFGLMVAFIDFVVGAVVILGCGIWLLCAIEKKVINKKETKIGIELFDDAMINYNKEMEIYNKKVEQAECEYKYKIAEYNDGISAYDKKMTNVTNEHDELLRKLENALEKLYNEDIIFQKYRNMVAITTINEYLESGRCYALEGPDGAYNLYEMELRQNIVIGQLSSVINNLEQIRNNQYMLYKEIKNSNEKIDEIIYEIKVLQGDTKLNAYFNYVTACAETSPKIIHTVSF